MSFAWGVAYLERFSYPRPMRIVSLVLIATSCTTPTEEPVGLPTGGEPWVWGETEVPETPYTMSGFSFVDTHAAGAPQPGRLAPLEEDLLFLVEQGIAVLVSLTVTPTDPLAVEAAGIQPVHLPIEDYHAPTLQQQFEFVEGLQAMSERGEKVAVHCTAGLGRTGTMLATWFVSQGLSAEDAIAQIRLLRPGSIETDEQEVSVYEFEANWP